MHVSRTVAIAPQQQQHLYTAMIFLITATVCVCAMPRNEQQHHCSFLPCPVNPRLSPLISFESLRPGRGNWSLPADTKVYTVHFALCSINGACCTM